MDPELSTQTTFPPGTQLGPYRIEARLGAGGMGEVFRGLDTRLGRPVAIKLAHRQFSDRFEREAKSISALNHPHICTLYDVGATPSGSGYLVMELVEGDTLAARLRKGALPMEQVLRYGAEIADALAAAHAKGITHRDLKPGNIMLSTIGVKVLDFGLSRSDDDDTLTLANTVLGTPAYMAPEQKEGGKCDARTDIYALGLILAEMATGKRQSTEGLTGTFAHVVELCLANDPNDRWHSACDVSLQLAWAGKSPAAARPAGEPSRAASRAPWIVAAVTGAAALAAALFLALRPSAPAAERTARFVLSLENQAKNVDKNFMVLPSPDGKSFVFPGDTRDGGTALWVRRVDSVDAAPLPGTQGASSPFWSPDGRWIGFYAAGKLKKISPSGGSPVTLASLPGFQDPAWGSHGDILYRPDNRAALFTIPESGGSPKQVTRLDPSLTENSHRFPVFLPGGRRFLFTTRCGQRDKNALYIGSLDGPTVKRVMPLESNTAFVAGKAGDHGTLFYYREGALVAHRFDPDPGVAVSDPVTVADAVDYAPASISAFFRVSSDGSTVVIRPAGSLNDQLTWFNRDGGQAGTLGSPADIDQPRISPDGSRVAFTRPDIQSGNRDVWSFEIARGILTRLTLNVANDWFPVWSPDSKRILFGSDRGGGPDVLPFIKMSLEPVSEESALPGTQPPFDWSRDGKWITMGTKDILVAPTSGDRTPFEYLATPFRQGDARFSPDGEWIPYSTGLRRRKS
jgi:serine/threonine protein kinase